MKLGRSESELQDLLLLEKQREEERKLQLAREEMEVKKQKIRDKEALIDELMFSEGNAKNIVETFASSMQTAAEKAKKVAPVPKATQFSTGIQFGTQGTQGFLPIPKQEEGPMFSYVPIEQKSEGPPAPTWQQVYSDGYINHVRAETKVEKAGGFKATIACLRALQEAMAGLYYNPPRSN